MSKGTVKDSIGLPFTLFRARDAVDYTEEGPMTGTPGPDGVEVLEIRTASNFDIKLLANNPAWWDKAAERLAENRVKWPEQTPPSGWKVG